MTQQLRGLVPLPENLGSISITYMAINNRLITPVPRESGQMSFWSSCIPGKYMDIHNQDTHLE